jgi:hypothetical protein
MSIQLSLLSAQMLPSHVQAEGLSLVHIEPKTASLGALGFGIVHACCVAVQVYTVRWQHN